MHIPSPEERADLYDYYDNPDEAKADRIEVEHADDMLPQYIIDRLAEYQAELAVRRAKATTTAQPTTPGTEPDAATKPVAELS